VSPWRHGAFAAVVAKLAFLRIAFTAPRFFAISDDDFSRLAIAQQFAAAPKLDPSGTSWLPLPFHAYGTGFALFGNQLVVAQALCFLLGLLGAAGVYFAARWASLTDGEATVAALIAALFPHSVCYGLATVPDYPTAVLAILAAASLANAMPRVRLIGALCALAATLCRYETWPLACVIGAFALSDARAAKPRRTLILSALLAPAGALAWMLHGALQHHDALFFVKRVTAYKRALGQPSAPLLERLFMQPLALIREEPELIVVASTLLLAVLLLLGRNGLKGEAWKRPAFALLAVLAFLVVGDLRDGSPTHHFERVLLSLWFGVALVIPPIFMRVRSALYCRNLFWAKPWALILPLGLLVAMTAWFVRPVVTKVEPFVNRSAELEMGRHLAARLPERQAVAVYTEDYGYFAIEAALGRPGALKPLLKRDPRHPELDPMESSGLLAAKLDEMGARYFVVPAAHRQKAQAIGRQIDSTAAFALFDREGKLSPGGAPLGEEFSPAH